MSLPTAKYEASQNGTENPLKLIQFNLGGRIYITEILSANNNFNYE